MILPFIYLFRATEVGKMSPGLLKISVNKRMHVMELATLILNTADLKWFQEESCKDLNFKSNTNPFTSKADKRFNLAGIEHCMITWFRIT